MMEFDPKKSKQKSYTDFAGNTVELGDLVAYSEGNNKMRRGRVTRIGEKQATIGVHMDNENPGRDDIILTKHKYFHATMKILREIKQ